MAIIQKVNVDGSIYNIASTTYATCDIGAAIAAKTIPNGLSGLVIDTGVTIHVKFINGNTATNPTLTISGALTSTGTDASSTAIAIKRFGTTAVGATAGVNSWSAGEVVSLTYDGTNWVASYNGDTTYTFSGGTNKFTVTPAGGTAQDITITPSITNNITGSGTSGSLAKFNDSNTITDGPALSSSIETQTQSTKFLREDGNWYAPSYTKTSLAVGNAASDTVTEAVTGSTTGVYVNLIENSAVKTALQFSGAGGITIGSNASGKITFTGKAGTVTSVGVTSDGGLSTSIANNGAITGNGTIGIATGGVTNDMLAGSIENAKLINDWIKIGNVTKHLGETFTLSDLGIAAAMNFKGITTTNLSDGATTSPITVNDADYTPVNGDVVLNSGKEFVWTGTAWEELGDESSWALSSDVLHISGATGDIIYWSNTDSPTHLTAGSNGAVLKLSNGVPTWGTDNDTKVTQAYSTADKSYPLLFSNTNGITSESSRGATTALVNNAIYVNPSSGTINATEFVGGGSGLTGVTAASVAWGSVTGKVFAALYVNTTSGGAANDTAATGNSNTYLHLYDNNAVQSTIKLIGAGGTSISSTANSKNITITSKKYKSTDSTNALTSLKLKYTDTSTTYDSDVSNATATPTALGVVSNAILYIKSLYYGTTSVSTGVSEDNT